MRPNRALREGFRVSAGTRISSSLAMMHDRPPDPVAVHRRGELGGDAPAVHHPDAIGKEQDLIEILADQKDAGAAVARGPQALMNGRGGANVEAAARTMRKHDTRRAGKFARD